MKIVGVIRLNGHGLVSIYIDRFSAVVHQQTFKIAYDRRKHTWGWGVVREFSNSISNLLCPALLFVIVLYQGVFNSGYYPRAANVYATVDILLQVY